MRLRNFLAEFLIDSMSLEAVVVQGCFSWVVSINKTEATLLEE